MARLGDVRARTLVLIGGKDIPSFQKLSAIAAEEMPNAKRIVVPGAAHMINMEKPETFNRIVREFFQSDISH